MAINKVIYGSKTLIDLSKDTITADKIIEGTTAHNRLGEQIVGTHQCERGIGTGKYVWAIYDTKEEWNYTTKSLSGTAFPSGYDSKVYSSKTITEDGYWQLNTGTGSSSYYLPTGATNGKTKTILSKSTYSALNPYSTQTIKDTIDTVQGDNLLGYISDSSSTAYPQNGIQDGNYYVLIMGSDANITSGKMLEGVIGYKSSGKVTGTIKSQEAQTITPGTTDKTISSGKYLSGAQTIKGDTNLVAGNIKKDVSIFGVTGTLESTTTEVDKTGNGEYIWRKCSPEIGWVETKKNTGSTTKPSGYSSTKYNSRKITDDGYYQLSSGIGLDEMYLPTDTENGKAKTILYKPYMSNYQIWTISDEKGETGNRGDTLYGYVSSTKEDAYPNSGVKDHYYYSLIFSPSANAVPTKMLKDTVAFGQTGKVTGSISSLTAQTITPTTSDQKISAGQYLSGQQTIKGDANLLAENIKSGVSIFGIEGTYSGSGGSSSLRIVNGSFAGDGAYTTTEIATGLTNIKKFVLYADITSITASGIYTIIYDGGKTIASGISYGSYMSSIVIAVGELIVNNGTVTYTPTNGKSSTLLTEDTTYNWVAIGT